MIVINKTIRPHFAEKTIEAYLDFIPQPQAVEFSQRLKIKTIKEIKAEENVKGKKFGIHVGDFKTLSRYTLALKNEKEYHKHKIWCEFHQQQVNGTIFAHEGTEGEIV